jgi:hypothetical protein
MRITAGEALVLVLELSREVESDFLKEDMEPLT